MIIEFTLLHVHPGSEDRFETAFVDALEIIRSAEGYLRHSVLRCVDEPTQYMLIVHWQKKENSTTLFANSGRLKSIKKKLHRFYEMFPATTYYEMVNLSTSPEKKAFDG